jgi:curved DNA-binding protein CbpA
MAYQTLRSSSERKKYDKDRKGYILGGELDPIVSWDEQFAENASGTDSGSDSDDDDSEEEEEEEMKPDTFRLEIYKESTSWVAELFTNPYDTLSISKINRLNEVITKRNKKDGLQEGEFLISINVLRAISIAAKWAAGSLRLQEKVEKQLEMTIRINGYPQQWLALLPWIENKRPNLLEEGLSSE